MDNYFEEGVGFFHDLIVGSHPTSFSRRRKLSKKDLLLQMIGRHGKTQWAEVLDFCDHRNMTITDKGFFMARMKFNPEAVRIMADDFIAGIYDNYEDSMKTWKGMLILAVDGSKVTVPNTEENRQFFGSMTSSSTTNMPCQALVSSLHDTLNQLKLDIQVDRIDQSERYLALEHFDWYSRNYSYPAVFVLDRGYVSIRIMDRLIQLNQFFLIRAKSTDYVKYFEQVKIGESKTFDVTFDRVETNYYREDRHFRNHLLSTSYKLRFAKTVIAANEDGEDSVEYLITNLPEETASTEELKELYWKRWGVETSYNQMKNRMKLEEFSGYRTDLILQDIYADMWMYNYVGLKIIEANEKKAIEQKEDGEYTIKRNFNKTVGTLKMYFLRALMTEDREERTRLFQKIGMNIESALCWVKKGERQFERKRSVNKSSMSYRKTY